MVGTSLGKPARGATGKKATIGQTFSAGSNSLNLLRLVLAATVLLGHAYELGLRSDDILGRITMGTVAVYGFFGISGYLITASATRNRVGRYLWQRFLRIFPAFWVCLVVTAFCFGLAGWYHDDPHCGISCYVHVRGGPLSYIYENLFLKINQESIRGTLRGTIFPLWDGSLWTLFYEFLCYLILAGLAATTLLRDRLTVAVVATAVWIVALIVTVTPSLVHQIPVWRAEVPEMLELLPVFLAGSLLYLYRERVPDSGVLAIGCVGIFLVGLVEPFGNHHAFALAGPNLLAPALAYPLLWLGIHLPFNKVGARNDYSYGVYIYAWPVSQLLMMWGANRWGYAAYAFLVVGLTTPFAVASWWLVEKHALKLKRWTPFASSTAARVPFALRPPPAPSSISSNE